MRAELEQIERIEKFLSGTMDSNEKILFEKELAINPELKEALDTQSLMVTAINRKALLAQVQHFAPPRSGATGSGASFLSKFKWPIILSSIVVGALITWISTRNSDTTEEITGNTTSTEQNQQAIIAANDLLLDTPCSNDQEGDYTFNPAGQTWTYTSNETNIGGLETWVRPEIQQIQIDPTKDELVECDNGTLILVPKNAFVDNNGKKVESIVTLEIVEALTFDRMVAYNLSTMSDGKPLESGGMIYIQPKVNGENVDLADGKSIHIEIPTDNYNSEMKAWQGVPDGDGNLNWENPQEIENYLTPVDMASLDFIPYGFREEVQSNLPFRNHKTSSKELEDSLYYSFGAMNEQETTWETATIIGNNNDVSIDIPKDVQPSKQKKISSMKVLFDNLPEGERMYAEVSQGKSIKTYLIEDNVVKPETFPGTGRIRVYSSNCEIVFNQLEFAKNMELTLDCINIDCKVKDDIVPTKFVSSGSVSSCERCYIDPASVKTIHDEEFKNTFIATREFQERLQALHKMKNAQQLLDLYINQLDKDLYLIDAQVTKYVEGKDRKVFQDFTAQKLTNVKPSDQNHELLKEYYSSQLKKEQNRVKSRRKAYQAKTREELENMQQEFAVLNTEYRAKRNNALNNFTGTRANSNSEAIVVPNYIRSSARPNVATQSAYKVNWFGTGWMNIDAFLHELSKGEKIVPISVANNDENTRVYQSINSLSTLLTLNNTGKGFEAHFPNTSKEKYKKSIGLAIKRKPKNRFEMAATTFNPYVSSEIELSNWKEYGEREFKSKLLELNPGSKNLINSLEAEQRMIQDELANRKRLEKRKKEHEEELAQIDAEYKAKNEALKAKQKALLEKQAKERAFIQNLEDFINPCSVNYSKKNDSDITEPRLSGIANIKGKTSGSINIKELCSANGIKNSIPGAIITGYTIQYRSCVRDVEARIRGARISSTVCDEIRDCGNEIEISFTNIEGRDENGQRVDISDFTLTVTPNE